MIVLKLLIVFVSILGHYCANNTNTNDTQLVIKAYDCRDASFVANLTINSQDSNETDKPYKEEGGMFQLVQVVNAHQATATEVKVTRTTIGKDT